MIKKVMLIFGGLWLVGLVILAILVNTPFQNLGVNFNNPELRSYLEQGFHEGVLESALEDPSSKDMLQAYLEQTDIVETVLVPAMNQATPWDIVRLITTQKFDGHFQAVHEEIVIDIVLFSVFWEQNTEKI